MTYKDETPNCDMREALVAYLYGEATPDETREVQSHVSRCVACKQELESFERVRGMLQQWQLDDLPVVRVVANGPKRGALSVLRELFSLTPMWGRVAGGLAAAMLLLAVMGTQVTIGSGGFSVHFDLFRHGKEVAVNSASPSTPDDNVEKVRADVKAYVQQLILETEQRHSAETSAQLVSFETQLQNMRSADLAKLATRIQQHQQRLRTIEQDIDRREGLDLTDILFSEATETPRPRSTVSGGE